MSSSGEQPGRGGGLVEDGVASAVLNELQDEVGEGFGEDDGRAAELECDVVSGVVDVVGGEAADGPEVLGIEQEQEADDPVGGLQGVVLQEAGCVVPAFLAVVRSGRSLPADGGEGESSGVAVGEGPADEVPGLVSVADLVTACPASGNISTAVNAKPLILVRPGLRGR
jgi:hypothetical protein